jgi:hypothetical protein
MWSLIRKPIAAILAAGLMTACLPGLASAKNLDEGLKDIAQDVFNFAKANIQGKGISSVRVLEFEAPGNFRTAGRTVQRELQQKLEALIAADAKSTLKVNQKVASHDIGGEMVIETSDDDTKVMVRIICKVKTSLGSELQQFSHLVEGPTSDIARLTTPTVDVSAASASKDSDAVATQVKESIENPKVAIQDAKTTSAPSSSGASTPNATVTTPATNPPTTTNAGSPGPSSPNAGSPVVPNPNGERSVVRATDASRFGLQIRVADSPEGSMFPAEASNEGGLAFINAKRGQRFAVTIINDAEFDVGVRLTLDGVDSFHFSENPVFKQNKVWLIHRRSALTIPGWYVRDPLGGQPAISKDFVFTDLPDSIAARFASKSSEIGIINAQFFPAWKISEQPPKEEFLGGGAGTRGVLGVGDGQERQVKLDIEPRHFGRSLLASVSVRYEQPEPPKDLPPSEPDAAAAAATAGPPK